MDKNKLFLGIGVAVFILVATFIAYSLSNKTAAEVASAKLDRNAFIYFYGDTCPHCQELSAYLKNSGIDKKIKYQKLEVYNSQPNQALMQQAAEVCKLDTTQGMGVPFVFKKGKCYIGSPEAQKVFDEAAKEATGSGK